MTWRTKPSGPVSPGRSGSMSRYAAQLAARRSGARCFSCSRAAEASDALEDLLSSSSTGAGVSDKRAEDIGDDSYNLPAQLVHRRLLDDDLVSAAPPLGAEAFALPGGGLPGAALGRLVDDPDVADFGLRD